MTSIIAISLAFALIINDFTLLCSESLMSSKFLASNLVYLISISLLLREFNAFPSVLWRKWYFGCFLAEVALAFYILESSVTYVWSFVQDYIVSHSNVILEHVSDKKTLNWLVCHICCGKFNCASAVADVVLKVVSFGVLLSACLLVRK